MSRLNALADRAPGQSLGLTNYDNLEADVNYLTVAGANIPSAAALTVTAEFHIVTGTATVATITDALGPVAGQQVRLLFQSALTIQNNGGGTGNIRTVRGVDRIVAPNEIVTFVYDGTVWREAGKGLARLLSANSLLTITSTTTETDILNVSVPANMLGPNGKIRFYVEGDGDGPGGGAGWTMRVYLGATKLWDSGNQAHAAESHSPVRVDAEVANLGATNSQSVGGWWAAANASSPPLAGNALIMAPSSTPPGAVDTTVAQTFRVSVQPSATSITFRRFFGGVDIQEA